MQWRKAGLMESYITTRFLSGTEDLLPEIVQRYLWEVINCTGAKGCRARAAERGAICPSASGSRGPHRLISTFLFCMCTRFQTYLRFSHPSFPLLSASARFKRRGPHFAILPLGLENLSAPLCRAVVKCDCILNTNEIMKYAPLDLCRQHGKHGGDDGHG